MSETESSEVPTLSSDSSLDTMLSAAVMAREVTTSGSSEVSDSIREGLAVDFEDSSGSEVAVDDTAAIVHVDAPGSVPTAAGGGRMDGGVDTGGPPPPPPIWGPGEERLAQGFSQPRPGQRVQDDVSALPSVTDRLMDMLRQDAVRREEERQRQVQEERQRQLQEEARRARQDLEHRQAMEALLDQARALSQAGSANL